MFEYFTSVVNVIQFLMEELSLLQQNFLNQIDLRYQKLCEFRDYDNGTSSAFESLVVTFNTKIHDFIQQMLDELQKYTSENIVLSESYEYVSNCSEIFKNSYNNLLNSVYKMIENNEIMRVKFNEVVGLLIKNEKDNMLLINQNNKMKKGIELYKKAIDRYEIREKEIINYFKKELEEKIVTKDVVDVFKELKEILNKKNEADYQYLEMNNKINELEKLVEDLKEKNENEKDDFNDRIRSFQIDLENKKTLLNEKNKQIEEANNKCQRYENNLEQLQDKIDLFKDKNNNLKKKIEEREKEFLKLKNDYDKAVELRDQFNNDSQHWHNMYKDENVKMQELTHELTKLKERNSFHNSPEIPEPDMDETREIKLDNTNDAEEQQQIEENNDEEQQQNENNDEEQQQSEEQLHI